MRPHQPDYLLISIIFILVIAGLVILSSASVVLSQDIFKQNYYFLKHQLLYSLPLGLLCFFICQKVNYKFWQKIAFPLIILSLILLVLVLIPGLGYDYKETKRWLILDHFSIQPFEFFKLVFIIYLAALLSRRQEIKQVIKESLIPVLIVSVLASVLVIFQPNFSAVAMIFFIALLIYFLAGLNVVYLSFFSILALAGLFALIKTAPYRTSRLIVYLHPEIDPQGIGYQINQALLAIGSGGLFGLGLGHSIQKWQYLPEPIGDSIFAIAAEELGLVGAGLLVIFFIVLAWRGFIIAKNSLDKFAYLLAGGISGWLFIQAFVNIAAICGLIPLTGMPLPFISYGGSSLVVSLASVGILVNISKHTK